MKKLYKSSKDIKVDGVCGGVAEYFGIDATLVRLIWILFSFWGAGIIVYIVCSLVIPRGPKNIDVVDQPINGNDIDYRDKL